MPDRFRNTLVVGISSTALFDLSQAHRVFVEEGIGAYRSHMLAHEREPLAPGTGFALVHALLRLNAYATPGGAPLVEVIVMSQNSPETSVGVMNAVQQHGLGITRFAFTGGEPLSRYVKPFGLDLFLSTNAMDVQRVADTRACAAAVLYPPPPGYASPDDQVRVALDADAVLFSEESEVRYKQEGLAAFHAHEAASRDEPLADGPFAPFLRKLAKVKESLSEKVEYSPVRIAIVTARNAPAQSRVITTLRSWNVYVDEAFFLGGLPKKAFLAGFRPHIFFDDQDVHVGPASAVVPSGRVLYVTGSPLQPASAPRAADPEGYVPLNRSPADTPRVEEPRVLKLG